MKRYEITYRGEYGYCEDDNGEFILYDEFVNFISARIKELEAEIQNEVGIYSEASCRFRIDELKILLKWNKK